MLPPNIPTASASSLTTTAWWPMPDCSFLPPSPSTRVLRELVDRHLDLGERAGTGEHGGQDADAGRIRLGWRRLHRRRRCAARRWTVRVLGCMVKTPSTLGHLPAQLSLGACPSTRPREPPVAGSGMGRWGQGPGDSPLNIDLDSTICEAYGLAKEGARHHGYTGAREYDPLLAIAAGTGEC